jgi:hypothetical protein
MVRTLSVRRLGYEESNTLDLVVVADNSPTLDRDWIVHVNLIDCSYALGFASYPGN